MRLIIIIQGFDTHFSIIVRGRQFNLTFIGDRLFGRAGSYVPTRSSKYALFVADNLDHQVTINGCP